MVATALAGPDGMLTTLLIGGLIVVLLLLGWFLVYTLMQAGAGSIGMRAQGLRLVAAREQRPLGFGRALLRNIIFGLACAIVVGYFTPAVRRLGSFPGLARQGRRFADGGCAGDGSGGARAECFSGDVDSSRTWATGRVRGPRGRRHPAASGPAAMPTPVPFAAQSAVPAPVIPPPSRPGLTAPADDESLIAFVPGITQEDSPLRTPAPAPQPDAGSDLDATVLGYRPARPVRPERAVRTGLCGR